MCPCAGCPRFTDETNIKIIEKITINQMQMTEEIYIFMKKVIENGGALGKIPIADIHKMVDYYNKFFNENKTAHLKRDLDEAYNSMKALYHRIRRGEIEMEEVIIPEVQLLDAEGEQVNADKLCEVCGKKLHWNSKNTKCKKCRIDNGE